MDARQYAIDPATGEIKGWEWTSPQQRAWAERGLEIVNAPSEDGQGEEITAESHYFDQGAPQAKAVVILSADKPIIAADGLDEASVTVEVQGASPASIKIEVAGQAQEVELMEGLGYLPPITTATPTAIEVRVVDQVRYLDNGGCAITAQEV